MRVRRATSADVPVLVRLFEELDSMQRDWRVFTPRPGFYDEIGAKYRAALDKRGSVVLVAEDGGEIVGMAYGESRVPSRFSDERALELSSVVVRMDRRGQGIGRALVLEAGRFASEEGLPWIELKTFVPNQASMEFWEGLGFTPRVVQLTSATKTLNARLAHG